MITWTLFAVLALSNSPDQYWVIDYDLTQDDCLYALEELHIIMAPGIELTCEPSSEGN